MHVPEQHASAVQSDAVVNLHMNGAGVFTCVMEGGWAGLAAIMQLNLRDC